MFLLKLWIFLSLLTSATGDTLNANNTDIVDAIAGVRSIIRTWPLKSSVLSVIVNRDNITLLNAFLDESIITYTTVQNGQLILKYNNTIKEVSLMFDKIKREHEGLYQIEESFNRSKEASSEIETEGTERKYGRWNLKLNVHETGEMKQGYVGETITMEFGNTSVQYTLFNYDQMVALLVGSICSVLTDSYWYGRLTCTSDVSGMMYKITIENVTQRDAGLYTLGSSRDESWQYFFSIKAEKTITDRTDEPSVPESACYVESVVWGAVCMFLMMTTLLICMQRRNICRLEAAQIVLPEKCETVSFATPAPTREPLPMPPLEEVMKDQLATKSVAVCNAILGLHYAASTDLAAADSECSSTYSRVQAEYDKLTIDNCVDCKKSSGKFIGTTTAAYHDDIEEGFMAVMSPCVSTFVTTLGTDEYKFNETTQRQVAQSGLAAYAKVKKRQIVSSHNIAILYKRNEFAYETEVDGGYKSVNTPMNQICAEDVKVPDDEHSFVLRHKKQTEQKIIPGNDVTITPTLIHNCIQSNMTEE